MEDRILLVDDEPNILAAYKRQLRKQFLLEVAESGKLGLEVIENSGPFAVVVSDLQMPGMDGIQFLTEVKERAPDTVRMMLTGHAELHTAIDAVNEGYIFRFLTKPCPPEALAYSLRAGIKQYHLVVSEKDLLEKTLSGCVKVLTEILSLVNPVAFSRTSRLTRLVTHIVKEMQLPDLWQFQLAAMLSQIGCVTLPSELLEKFYEGDSLSPSEEKMFASHPTIARRLLSNIPRLESISRIIEGQHKQPLTDKLPSQSAEEYLITLGSQILRLAIDYDKLAIGGMSHSLAYSALQRRKDLYNPQILSALESYKVERSEMSEVARKLYVNELSIGMIFDENILANNGLLVARKGQEVTYPILVRLRNLVSGVGIVEPFRVRIESAREDS